MHHQHYNFSDAVRESVAEARMEAARLRHAYVGTQHLLLALTASRSTEASRILTSLGVDIAELRRRTEQAAGPGKATAPTKIGDLQNTPHFRKTIGIAMTQARDFGASEIGCDHLLLALALNEKAPTGQVLRDTGVRAEDLVTYIKTGSSPRPAFRIEVDDKSETLIWGQIVTKVQEAIATGRLIPGERLPPVRQLADDLGIAPGTVSRAYSALEESGVVTTEGARGTFVARRETPQAGSKERSAAVHALLRQVVVAAYHLGATADDLRKELEQAMKDIYGKGAAA